MRPTAMFVRDGGRIAKGALPCYNRSSWNATARIIEGDRGTVRKMGEKVLNRGRRKEIPK